ncbi:MAG: hypothetical protein WCP86_11765, partial [bacterium]
MNSHYILKRLGIAVLTIVVSSLLSFVVLRCMPGDIFESQARDLSRAQGITLIEAKRQLTLQY